ncbi:Hypothetical predicted protein [Mytilus galloprovincialis]|uniref:MYND-type domain-containing protein n=1 Tax=Mytilus galloprovincialis TaxID=29158 RepID=A0A8B6EZV8_MYTGA|nr:Hypothetical predicted protein [Mytilus galloprovincialis]
MFLQGYAVNQEIVKEIRQHTRALADFTLKMKSGMDLTFQKVHDAMCKINDEIMLACSRISSIESKQNEQQTDIGNLNKDVSVLYDRTLAIGNVQDEHALKIAENVSNTVAIARSVKILNIGNESTVKKIEDSLTTLAIDVDTTGKDFRETFKRTLKWLSRLNERWLLIVDNTDEEYLSDNIQELLGSWKRKTRGHIIVTSRREPNAIEDLMLVKIEDCICLNVFAKEEALDFLTRRTRISCDIEGGIIISLVDELGGLPLALEQAAAHIKSIKCSFSEYVSKFEKKRLKLLKSAPSILKMDKNRLAITTTWQLNFEYISMQSKNEGLGMAAATVMLIASFLFADDIPKELFNVGSPFVEDSNLVEVLGDGMGCKQIIEILTRFSLFQRVDDTSLSVHRLVQEVIRDNMLDQDRCLILQHAIRMVNKALHSSQSPADVLYNIALNTRVERESLVKWNKFAANANAIKLFVFNLKKDDIQENQLLFNKEVLKILQTTALYHSIYQRQAIALADQAQMIRIMTTINVDTKCYNDLTSIKIPLLQRDRETILDCLVSILPVKTEETCNITTVITSEADTYRILGNEAFKEKRYHEAIRYYTEGMRSCPIKYIDKRLFSNRSLAYIRIRNFFHAFSDANMCIEIAPDNWKGYCWKAYAVSGMIEDGLFPPTMEAMGLASACIASYRYPPCIFKYYMKICYPVINYKLVEKPECLRQDIMCITDRPFTTLLLRKGKYVFTKQLITTKSIQIIGIDDGIDIDTGPGFEIRRVPEIAAGVEPEQTIKTHFENVNFVSGNSITINANSIATFYNCTFSNEKKGCDAFPKCTGNKGCINPMKCRKTYQKDIMLFGNVSFGESGFPGIVADNGGTVYIDACLLNRCGGGGVLSVRKEARNEGAVKLIKNTISENQLHGIAIGPNGYGFIEENIIQGNGAEGIWCGGVLDSHESTKMNETGASRAVLIGNDIGQNGLSGISCEGCFIEIKGNRIFSNIFWGMMLTSRSSAYILNNDIFDNKCGGIRIGLNYTASIIIDGNSIRDHTGPGVYTDKSKVHVGSGEILVYSRPPIITCTNVQKHNDEVRQHPKDVVRLVEACSFCRHVLQNMKSCSKCKKATYCSKECQTKHWLRHKHLCKLLRSSYVVEVQMSETEINCLGGPPSQRGPDMLYVRTFNPKLKGILEGSPPNRSSCELFVVKIQSGKEYQFPTPMKKLIVYDQTVTLDIQFVNPTLYHLCMECGVLASSKLTTKKIFCWASFKNNGKTLCFYTDNLPPFQTW